jgi:hypothetical protein
LVLAYAKESGLSGVSYTGKSGVPGVAYTGELDHQWGLHREVHKKFCSHRNSPV